jgi:hypothetical protein
MAATLYCPGDISTEGGIPVCSSQWEVMPYTPPFDVSQLDPTTLGQAFGAGFTVVASALVVTIGIRALVNFVKTI